MARITVEDCLENENNRFALVKLASLRTRQLISGSDSLVKSRNKPVVTSLREIADGGVRAKTEEDIAAELERENRIQQAQNAEDKNHIDSANGNGSGASDVIFSESDSSTVESSGSESSDSTLDDGMEESTSTEPVSTDTDIDSESE